MSAPNLPRRIDDPGVPALEIARRVASGIQSAVEVLEDTFERLDRINPILNAIVHIRRDAAFTDARNLDARIRAGLAVGRLAGVPFTVKDVIATEGLPTTCGSSAMLGCSTDADASAVARLRQSDAVLIGKTNCPEFAFSIDTQNPRYGRTYNPLGDFTPGGSSGGEAASLASGISSVGLGTDFGGSIRWPAQCTHLVGLRPTVGRVPGSGQFPATTRAGGASPNLRTLQGRLQVIGPMARTVEDVECILHTISGPDHLDPISVPVPLLHSSSVDIGSIECRWGVTIGPRTVSDEVAVATINAAKILRNRCGSVIESLPGAMGLAYDLYAAIRDTEPLTELRQAVAGREHMLGDGISDLLSRNSPTSDQQLVGLWADRDSLRYELLQWLRGNRVLLMPVSMVAPSRLTTTVLAESRLPMSEAEIVAPCRIVSLFGLPSLSVPCGYDSTGGPLSVQLVAPPFREDLVLATGKLIYAQK